MHHIPDRTRIQLRHAREVDGHRRRAAARVDDEDVRAQPGLACVVLVRGGGRIGVCGVREGHRGRAEGRVLVEGEQLRVRDDGDLRTIQGTELCFK